MTPKFLSLLLFSFFLCHWCGAQKISYQAVKLEPIMAGGKEINGKSQDINFVVEMTLDGDAGKIHFPADSSKDCILSERSQAEVYANCVSYGYKCKNIKGESMVCTYKVYKAGSNYDAELIFGGGSYIRQGKGGWSNKFDLKKLN